MQKAGQEWRGFWRCDFGFRFDAMVEFVEFALEFALSSPDDVHLGRLFVQFMFFDPLERGQSLDPAGAIHALGFGQIGARLFHLIEAGLQNGWDIAATNFDTDGWAVVMQDCDKDIADHVVKCPILFFDCGQAAG